jgi:hypothetical protein
MIDYKSDEFVSVLKNRDNAAKLHADFKRLAQEKREYVHYLFRCWGRVDYNDSIIQKIQTQESIYEVCARKVKAMFLL